MKNNLFSFGNNKLPKTTAIFNMTSAHKCPSLERGLCQAQIDGKNKCYAFKAERMYPAVLPYRTRQAEFWANCTALDFVVKFIESIQGKRIGITALRFNEAGDFRGQADIVKAEKIAEILFKEYGITVYCYTSRSDLSFVACEYLIVNGSGFIKDGISGEFKLIKDKSEKPDGYGICPADCTKCVRCLTGKNTAVILH